MTFATLGTYGKSATATLVSKTLFYGASFISLWLVTHFLAKAEYGSYAFTLALMWFASVTVSLGLDQTVLVRVARRTQTTDVRGNGLISAALITALFVGTLLAILVALVAEPLSQMTGLPTLQFWLVGLAPTIPLIAAGSVFESWYLARGDVWRGQTFPAIGQVARVPILGLALVFGGSLWWVVAAEICVALMPILLFLADSSRERLGRPSRPDNSDVGFGLRMLVARIASEGIRRIDIFMLGSLAAAFAVADYNVAARLVVILDVGRELLQPGFTARAGRFLANSERDAVRYEFDLIRAPALLISLAIAAGLILLATPFLALFGDFDAAVPVLLVLVAGGLINVAFGPNSHFLKIAGHATPLLQIRVAMLGILFVCNLFLIPQYGAVGAAISSLFAVLASNILFCQLMLRREQIASIDTRTIIMTTPALVAPLCAAFQLLTNEIAASIVGIVTVAYAYFEPLSWKPASAALARLRRRP